MALEGQITGSRETPPPWSVCIDDITGLADELDGLLGELKQTVDIVKLAVREIETPVDDILMEKPPDKQSGFDSPGHKTYKML